MACIGEQAGGADAPDAGVEPCRFGRLLPLLVRFDRQVGPNPNRGRALSSQSSRLTVGGREVEPDSRWASAIGRPWYLEPLDSSHQLRPQAVVDVRLAEDVESFDPAPDRHLGDKHAVRWTLLADPADDDAPDHGANQAAVIGIEPVETPLEALHLLAKARGL